MSSAKDFSTILFVAYDKFMLPLGGKRVPTPYRRNEIGSFQKVGPEFQGKSSPGVLTETTKRLAKKQNFDLNSATVEEIRGFMMQNKLGIDCSGFSYRLINHLVKQVKGKPLTEFGIPHVGRTHMSTLTSDEFTIPVADFSLAQAGDLIRLNSGEDVLHGAVILDNKDSVIIYAHSSGITNPTGAHTDTIKDGKFPADLKKFSYNTTLGDGIKRLKILSCQLN